MGLIVSSFIIFFKEKRLDKIFEIDNLLDILELPLIEKIKTIDVESNSNNLLFLMRFLQNQKSQNIIFFLLGEINFETINKLTEFLNQKSNKSKNLKVYTSLDEFENSDMTQIKFIITSLGAIQYNELITFKKRSKLLENNFAGVIIIE